MSERSERTNVIRRRDLGSRRFTIIVVLVASMVITLVGRLYYVQVLDKNKPVRDARDLRGTIAELGGNVLRPATAEAGKRLAKELFKPENGSFNEVMDRIQTRRAARGTEESAAGTKDVGEPTAATARRLRRRVRGTESQRPS